MIAALEKEILSQYYTIPHYSSISGHVLSYKVEYTYYEYNVFIDFGGIKYLQYNYSDESWQNLLERFDGNLYI